MLIPMSNNISPLHDARRRTEGKKNIRTYWKTPVLRTYDYNNFERQWRIWLDCLSSVFVAHNFLVFKKKKKSLINICPQQHIVNCTDLSFKNVLITRGDTEAFF